jgi:cytochrome c oxidase subunit 2
MTALVGKKILTGIIIAIGFVLISVVDINKAHLDFAYPWQCLFQDPATPVMEGIISLHHDIMFVIILIVVFVLWMLLRIAMGFHHEKNPVPSNVTHGTAIEIIWTLTPAAILVVIAIPSFALLYAMEEVVDPAVTLKCIGHQWYWSYEYTDDPEKPVVFDSYMIADDDLEEGQLRLLEVDNKVVLPTNTHIRLLITSSDVLHCWAIPSFGTKLDAVPGRLNQVGLFIKREGTFYGQCSELCGVNHGFMPIVVESVPVEKYVAWLDAQS